MRPPQIEQPDVDAIAIFTVALGAMLFVIFAIWFIAWCEKSKDARCSRCAEKGPQ
ncbi:MAG TPA: hypothetical protein VHZ74_10580 [Bryobacteraceae bacterium]|jgi:hypothetical protein|nr:hypothetical protein [Bryobacteraceae bacterium]